MSVVERYRELVDRKHLGEITPEELEELAVVTILVDQEMDEIYVDIMKKIMSSLPEETT
jgi:hypothetical protein